MSFFAQHPRARWAAPVLAAALTVGGVATRRAARAARATWHRARPTTCWSTSRRRARPRSAGPWCRPWTSACPTLSAGALGGGSGSAGKLNPLSLLSGSHSWRVWFADPTHARLALVDGTDEYDVVRNGSDVWQWSSADASVAHAKVPADAENPGDARSPATRGTGAAGIPDLSNPDAVATWALSQLDPTTAVTSTRTDRVARRSAYGLVLTPGARAPGSGRCTSRSTPTRRSRSPLRSSRAEPPGPPWTSASPRSPWRGRRRPSSSSRRHPVPR